MSRALVVYANGAPSMPLRKIILAPDSFKETLSSADVAAAMAVGVARVSNSIIAHQCPIGDGGEGTMEAIVRARGGRLVEVRVAGPMGEAVNARYGVIDGGAVAVIELAQASGLVLLRPVQRDPMRTTTFGTGQLIAHAVAAGCREIIVCIGGSATVDGGAGIAQALGWRFLDGHDKELVKPRMCGGMLGCIARIIAPELQLPRLRVACDVTNPLCGPNGAAAVYGPQKGATPQQVRLLDDGLANLARIAGGDPDMPGAGAAGGAGYGLAAFFGATLERGIDLVLELVDFRAMCRGADLVITGEGRLDAQSTQGKACLGVAKAAHEVGVPTIAIVGSTGDGAESCLGPGKLSAFHSLADRFGVKRAMGDAKILLADLTEEVVRSIGSTTPQH